MFAALSDRERALLSNTDVLGYIQKENEETNIRAKAEGWTFWMTTAESIAADYNNVYDYLRDMQWSTFSDMYKEINNIRPRWDFSGWTLEDFERENEKLAEQARWDLDREAEEDEANRLFWIDEERRMAAEEEEYRLLAIQKAAEVWEDQMYDLQDRLSL